MSRRTNWAGNLVYSAESLRTPETLAEVCGLVKAARKVRVLGSRHSFSAIADTDGDQISLAHLKGMELDEHALTVSVGGGVTYEQLAPWLHARGYALANLASLPGITIAGACATATHGSGIRNGCLATSVRALELVDGQGDLVHLDRDRDGDKFLGIVVGLGSAGIVTSLTLDVEPTFRVAQTVYENLGFDELGRHFEAIYSSGYSVSVFTDWQHHRATQVWIKRRLDSSGAGSSGNSGSPIQSPEEFFGATRVRTKLHPLAGHDATSCTEQMGIPGPWHERLPHFAAGETPSSGQELQSEYMVPFENGFAAIEAVEKLRDQIGPLLLVTELRAIAADRLWMSMTYRQLSLGMHFTWKPEGEAVHGLLPKLEAALRPFGARPHWGKLFTMPADQIVRVFPRAPDFKGLLAELDPEGKFENAFTRTHLGA